MRPEIARWRVALLLATGLIVVVPSAMADSLPQPVARWELDDCDPGAASVSNVTGPGFVGTKVGPVGCNVGRRGLAGAFPGAAWVDVPDPGRQLGLGSALTVGAWVRPQPGGVVASRGRRAGSWSLEADAARIRFVVQLPCEGAIGERCRLEATAAPVFDRWVHLAGVYRAAGGVDGAPSVRLFVDGTPAVAAAWHETDDVAAGDDVVRLGRGRPGMAFRGLLDEVTIFDRALGDAEVPLLMNPPEERLRIVYSATEAYFQSDLDRELGRVVDAGFNTIWEYFLPPSTPTTRRRFADACAAKGLSIVSPSFYLSELASHPAVIGFWTFDEPHRPIEEQRAAYRAVKAVTSKRVFVVRADFADVTYRGTYAPDVQDVDLFDIYPYGASTNPTADVDVGKLLTFFRVAQLFVNRTTDLDKTKLSRFLPVFQGFMTLPLPNPMPAPLPWLKGDTLQSDRFLSRLAGQPVSHGVFIWDYPWWYGSERLVGLGQGDDWPQAAELYSEYQSFAAELAAGLHDDLGLQYFTAYELGRRETAGRYTLTPEDLNNGSGRFGVAADAQGNDAEFQLELRKGSGRSFQRLYAAVSSVNVQGPAFDDVEIAVSYLLPVGAAVEIKRWTLGAGFRLEAAFVDLPAVQDAVTVRVRVGWGGRSSRYAALLGAAVALE